MTKRKRQTVARFLFKIAAKKGRKYVDWHGPTQASRRYDVPRDECEAVWRDIRPKFYNAKARRAL